MRSLAVAQPLLCCRREDFDHENHHENCMRIVNVQDTLFQISENDSWIEGASQIISLPLKIESQSWKLPSIISQDSPVLTLYV